MGNICVPATEEDKNARALDKKLEEEHRKGLNAVKILLLGAGESGKSTIFKQMKIIHKEGYTDDEREKFRQTVFQNCIQNMRDLVQALPKLGIDAPAEISDAATTLPKDDKPLTSDGAHQIKMLWSSDPIQAAYGRRTEFQLGDSAKYYFDQVETLAAPDYVPTNQDILRTRVRTTGIVELHFDVNGLEFVMYDVGGQRNERRKWIHCFDKVKAVLFVVAMSEYDQSLFEDESQNRMLEAVRLFGEICNSRFFEKTSMILFLNKKDLFEEKIKQVDLNVCFEDYKGGKDATAATKYISSQFTSQNRNSNKEVYVNVTCATDTKNISFVFNAVKDIVLTGNLVDNGFL